MSNTDSHGGNTAAFAPPSDAGAADDATDGFEPVPVRYRHDGWIPDKQLEFIEALADCGCVEEAAGAVGMSRKSAYALRRRHDAQAFRLAWDAALDHAVSRLAESALSRAIHGVTTPVYYKGEQVGERRLFNERLTMFLLRHRDPTRYGRWRDRVPFRQHPDGPVTILTYRIGRMLSVAWDRFNAMLDGKPAPAFEPEPMDWEEQTDEAEEAQEVPAGSAVH